MKSDSNKRIYVKYASDKSVKERLQIWFIKDHRKAIRFRIFNLILKVASCFLYVLEVLMNPTTTNYSSSSKYNKNLGSQYLNLNELPSIIENENASSLLQMIRDGASGNSPSFDSDLDDINWQNIFFVKRNFVVRYTQLVIAFYGLFESLFYFYLSYNGNIIERININTFIELLVTIPWIIEFIIPDAKDIFIPVFLNCWLIKRNLNYIFKDFNNISIKHHNSVIGQHLISLGTLFSCLIFTSVCGFQHLQRANLKKSVSLFDSLYYIIITFSTVGYGDITPDTWPSKLFMSVMIIVALVVIPTQLEHLASLWFERQNLGASYSSHRAAHEKHIVVCSTALQYDLIIDFLNEFYAHRKNHTVHTILLSSSEMDIQLRSLLHTPLWKQRVFYIYGSALRDNDLERAKVHQAKAVFIIASRGIDKDLADQHSILRSWAIKDFAPNTPQFVQLFRPENKINIKFAEYLVCEDEFKYALLANNCLCPGISTLVTLLLHKSKMNPKEKEDGTKGKWQELYSRLAGNEMHSITAENSKFFQEFVGQSFTQASFIAHKKYNVCLIGIGKQIKRSNSDSSSVLSSSCSDDDIPPESSMKTSSFSNALTNYSNKHILLNPGSDYLIEPQDLCFYISIVKEENYNWKDAKSKIFAVEELYQNFFVNGPDLTMRRKANERREEEKTDGHLDRNYNVLEAHAEELMEEKSSFTTEDSTLNSSMSYPTLARKSLHDIKNMELVIGRPPNLLYIGSNPTLCKLLKVPNQLCCLELNKECEHKTSIQASDYKWRNKCILIVAEFATNGLFNFILPLRAQVRSTMFLKPIVLLLENPPTVDFLEAISCFPLVYWMQGTINNINTILKAGIMDSDTVIVVSPEKYAHIDDDSLTDCSNIVSVQNLYRLFPKIKVVTELTKATNIRFMKFRARAMIKDQGSSMAYMFRLPFMSGNVFSASMIDTLLYQTYGKPYLIELIRLLIGISQSPGSGNLTSIPLTEEDMWIKTYGNLYKKLISTSGEIPIGLYRTKYNGPSPMNGGGMGSASVPAKIRYSSKHDIQQMIFNKMNKLGIDPDKYKSGNDHSEKFSFVLINPASEFPLKAGDIIYLLKPRCNNSSNIAQNQMNTKNNNTEIVNGNEVKISSLNNNENETNNNNNINNNKDSDNSNEDFFSIKSNSLLSSHRIMSMHSMDEIWQDPNIDSSGQMWSVVKPIEKRTSIQYPIQQRTFKKIFFPNIFNLSLREFREESPEVLIKDLESAQIDSIKPKLKDMITKFSLDSDMVTNHMTG